MISGKGGKEKGRKGKGTERGGEREGRGGETTVWALLVLVNKL